jgi:hypothetical protein
MPSKSLPVVDEYMIVMCNPGVHQDWAHCMVMPDRTPTVEKWMQPRAGLDRALNYSQSGSDSGLNTNTKSDVSVRIKDSKNSDITGTPWTAHDDYLHWENCIQVGYVLRNCPLCDVMKMVLSEALVDRDAPKVNSGRSLKEKNKGGTQTSWEVSGWLPPEKEVKHMQQSRIESELESLSDSDSQPGTRKAGQELQLYRPSNYYHFRYHQNRRVNWC